MHVLKCKLNTGNLSGSCLQYYQTTLVHLIEVVVGQGHPIA